MYIKKLHISNFRCFRDYTIEFAPGVTVLFGKNGSGKSTLIHAIHKALSFAFKQYEPEEDGITLSSGFPSLKPKKFNRKEDIVRDDKTGLPLPFINIHAEAYFLGADLQWDMYALTSTFALQHSKYKIAYQDLTNKIKETGFFPVFAYFSDSFPHISTKAATLTKTQLSLRNLAYLGWDDETAYSDLWIKRLTQTWTLWQRTKMNVNREESALMNCEKLKTSGMITDEEYHEDKELHEARLSNERKNLEKYDPEISAIRDVLVKFSNKLPGIDVIDFFVSVYEEEGVCLKTKDDKNTSFEKLPAGYKRILYMALDIAYRSYILNGTTNSEGIVVIDEIDLHLHPALEQVILHNFQEIFPQVQFIVSTHSPLVLTEVSTVDGNNSILKMEQDTQAPIPTSDIYGLDYNTGVQEIMKVNSGDEELEWAISEYAFMLKHNLTEQADILKQQILEKELISELELNNRIKSEIY